MVGIPLKGGSKEADHSVVVLSITPQFCPSDAPHDMIIIGQILIFFEHERTIARDDI